MALWWPLGDVTRMNETLAKTRTSSHGDGIAVMLEDEQCSLFSAT